MARRLWLAVGILLATAPAASAAELQAAYDFYVPGQGFQIGLVNAATGVARPLPAGVNTADDELHPALSRDGRFLVFTRMKLLPKLNGDIPVPAQRTLVAYDLQAGQVVAFSTPGAGPTFTRHGIASSITEFAWAITPEAITTPSVDGNTRVMQAMANAFEFPNGSLAKQATDVADTSNLFVPHAAFVQAAFVERLNNNTICTPICSSPRDIRYMTLSRFDPLSGALLESKARMAVVGPPDNAATLQPSTLTTLEIPGGGHAIPRAADEFVALDRNGDIQTITFPGETDTTPAPTPITTADDERMPAWSPDGLQLGFVRTTGGRRKLGVYDLTPGIQAILNPLVDLGADAPTPQTRVFQSIWGGVSLAPIPAAPAVTCDLACITRIRDAGVLVPLVTKPGTKIGILIVRRTGATRTVLGVKQPKIKVVAKVPLGTARKGRNRFGELKRKLKPGKYLLTYRLLRGDDVTTLSKSIPLTVRR